MHFQRLAVVLAGLAVLAASGARVDRALAHGPLGELESALAGQPNAAFSDVPGLGPTRRTSGGWLEVLLPDGTVITTHGSDPRPHESDAFAAGNAGGKRWRRRKPRPLHCVDPQGPRLEALYTRPRGKRGRLTSAKRLIRRALRRMNYQIHETARRSSRGQTRVDFTTRCTKRGRPVVSGYRSPNTTREDDTLTSLVGDAMAAGHDDPNAKYLIFYDDHSPGRCGTSQIHRDDRRSVTNRNNGGRMYAVIYGRYCWVDDILPLHEASHMMGAVQHSAPNSTRGFHCNDLVDVMCYADGGVSSEPVMACRGQKYDCQRNDYFDPRASSGYLATHWNLAWSGNSFLSIRSRP